jgi:hypothetical protein
MEAGDNRAWKAPGKAMQRSDVGLRFELLDKMRTYHGDGKHPEQRLAILSSFLNDTAVLDAKANPDMFDGLYSAFPFSRLEVRNFAAMVIASNLKIPTEPKPEWTAARWALFRAQVCRAIDREAGAKKGGRAESTKPKEK